MKRFALLLNLYLVLFVSGLAHGQIALNDVERYTACELYLIEGGGPFHWTDGFYQPGPYFQDLDVVEGDHHLRSVHDTSVILNGSSLTVSGSFLGTLSTDDQADLIHARFSANLLVTFVPSEPLGVSIEVDLPGGSEVFFFDMTDHIYDFDNAGPGVFTLDDSLIPGHEYLFQVFYNNGIYSEGPQQLEKSVTLSMTVAPDPVGATEVAWGAVKSLFR